MENIVLIEPRKTFDFQNNKVEILDLPTLRRTQKEDIVQGVPLREIYHFTAIENVSGLCQKHNLNYEIEEIFAAQNQNKMYPGVTVLKDLEITYGEKAVETHLLRRVYTTIRIKNFETDELTTTLVLAYHQEGIQAAIGPCVRICHNQCIMSSDRTVRNYGKDKVSTEVLFKIIDGWLSEFEN